MSKKNKPLRAKLIVNPLAGVASESRANLEQVLIYLKKSGVKVDLALAVPKEKATGIARKGIKDGYKIIIAMGGDGTLEAVIRALVGSKVHMGIIPVGTENNIVKSLGIPENLEEACALIATDHIRRLDVGRIKSRKGKKFFFFELTAIGLVAALYPEAKGVAKGRLAALKDAALTFIRQETKPKVFLTLDDESKIKVETMFVLVSNTPIFGKNFLVDPHASLEDGLLDVSVYPDFSKSELLRYFGNIMNEGYSGDAKVQRYQVRKLEVKATPKMEVMADGIILGKGTVEIKIHPGALRVIVPPAGPTLAEPRKNSGDGIAAPHSLPAGKKSRKPGDHPPESIRA